MSEDKQQTWAEAVVECVADEKERTRLRNLYEPDEMAAALLRQVAIANDLRAALTTRDEQIIDLRADRDSWREQADEMATETARWLARVRELESGDVLSERMRLLHVAEERVAQLEAEVVLQTTAHAAALRSLQKQAPCFADTDRLDAVEKGRWHIGKYHSENYYVHLGIVNGKQSEVTGRTLRLAIDAARALLAPPETPETKETR